MTTLTTDWVEFTGAYTVDAEVTSGINTFNSMVGAYTGASPVDNGDGSHSVPYVHSDSSIPAGSSHYATMNYAYSEIPIWEYSQYLMFESNRSAAALSIPAGSTIVGLEMRMGAAPSRHYTEDSSYCDVMWIDAAIGYTTGSRPIGYEVLGGGNIASNFTSTPSIYTLPKAGSYIGPGIPDRSSVATLTYLYNFPETPVHTLETILNNIRMGIQFTAVAPPEPNPSGSLQVALVTNPRYRVHYTTGSTPPTQTKTGHTFWL